MTTENKQIMEEIKRSEAANLQSVVGAARLLGCVILEKNLQLAISKHWEEIKALEGAAALIQKVIADAEQMAHTEIANEK